MSIRIKSYLSFSQYTCFRASKQNYINTYIKGFKFQSKYLDFGKKIADVLESRKPKDDNEKIALRLLKKPKHCELGIRVDFHGIPLYGKLDGLNEAPELEIEEYKTGKSPWTQKKVDNAEQLTFYAIMASIKYKMPIDKIKIKLIWLETLEDTDGSIFLTGKKVMFQTKRTKIDEVKIYLKIRDCWIGIEKLITEYIN